MKWVPERYNEVLVNEFYATFKGELQKLYLQGQLWKGGEPIPLLVIQGVRVDIFP